LDHEPGWYLIVEARAKVMVLLQNMSGFIQTPFATYFLFSIFQGWRVIITTLSLRINSSFELKKKQEAKHFSFTAPHLWFYHG